MRETVRAGSGWTASLGPGKTTWARELTGAFRAHGRPALHLSTDDFHHPRARRHRRGRTSAAGYYADAYDFAALAEHVLRPLGPGATAASVLASTTWRATNGSTSSRSLCPPGLW